MSSESRVPGRVTHHAGERPQEESEQAAAARTERAGHYRALVMADAKVVYRMSPDWTAIRHLDGQGFIADARDVSDRWLDQYIPLDDQPRVLQAIQQAVGTKSLFELEHRVRRVDGSVGWALSRAVPLLDEAGEVVEWFGVAADVTMRHHAEEALRASEARLRLALDVAELGTWTWNLVDGSGDLDARGAEIVGLVPGTLADVAQAQLASIHPEDLGAVHAAVAAGLARGPQDPQPIRLDYRVVHPDGTVHYVASRAVLLTDAAGRPVRLVGTNRDVTAERTTATERERLLAAERAARAEAEVARSEAEAASRAKGEFLAVMSHELRTPLNAIGGYAELIELGIHGPVTPEQRTALERIQTSQRALLSVINEVLNYARLETGAVTYALTDVPVAEAVSAAEALVAPQLRTKGLGYVWAGCDPGLAVRADRDKLQQILLNLLSNAIKFTDARDGEPGRVEVSGESHGGRAVLIRVRDTGIGIPVEQLEAIFEPFVQVDTRLTRVQHGTGLGLAISRDLARGMGGGLVAESTLGQGSTFTLTLPPAESRA